MSLRKWKPSREPVPFASMFIASRRSGKSYLLRELYLKYWYDKFDSVIVFCPTGTEYYEEFIFGDLFFTEFNPDIINSVIYQQEKRKKEGKEMLEVLIIMDDCSDDQEKNQTAIQKIYTKGRHLKVSIIYSTQETTLTGTVWRNNSDFICIGKQLGGRGRENIVDNFLLGMAEPENIPEGTTERTFLRHLVRKYTEDHNFIVLSFTSVKNDFENNVLTYKAEDKKQKVKKPKKKTEEILIEPVEEEE